MGKGALGKGLSALIPDKEILNDESQSKTANYIETALINDSSFQPRMEYNDEKLDELISSIKEKGILQPILIREKGESYEVIAGERRLRAARSLSLEKVPVIIKNVSDQEALVIALIENIQREELNPIEEAEAYKRLTDDFGYTQEAVADSVGKNRSTITNLLRLLTLSEGIKKSIHAGDISVGHARTLLSLESENDRNRAFEATIKKKISVRQLEGLVKKIQKGDIQQDGQRKQKSQQIIDLEEKMQQMLGTKVDIQHRRKKGKIIIEYYSSEDLDRIVRTMIK